MTQVDDINRQGRAINIPLFKSLDPVLNGRYRKGIKTESKGAIFKAV